MPNHPPGEDAATLDKNAQKALAYLSGIPTSEDSTDIETTSAVTDKVFHQFQQLIGSWLKFQAEEIRDIGQTLFEIIKRVDLDNKKNRTRLESPQYLKLVRKSFRNWTTAESNLKREFIQNLLVNASINRSSPDYVISIFIDWLDKYSDEHLMLIKELYQAGPTGLTRYELWHRLHSYQPGEDSAEADLYKLLMLDLTTGHIIHQERGKDFHGNFMKAPSKQESAVSAIPLSTTFDNSKHYVLTELGIQFVIYIIQEQTEQNS